jgi:hypothetical protein
MYGCTFKLYSPNAAGQLEEVVCPDGPLVLNQRDVFLVILDEENYRFQLKPQPLSWTWTSHSFPALLLEILNSALKLGKVISGTGDGKGKTYAAEAHSFINGFGLCPCRLSKLNRLDAGQIVQLWSGELLSIDRKGRLQYLAASWTPGKDRTIPQRSRYWE